MQKETASLDHFKKWIQEQINRLPIVLRENERLSDKDNLILAHSYCRNFPNRLPYILAEFLNGPKTV